MYLDRQLEEPEVALSPYTLQCNISYVALAGDDHRRQRKMLGSVFSTDQLRQLTPKFYEVTRKVSHVLYYSAH